MFKCAIIGVSGKRAIGHSDAYQHVKRGVLAAISTRNKENLEAFGDKYGIDARYTDYREMLEREKPDVVHLNTPPDVRLEIFEAAEAAGVKGLITEKPLAVGGEDYQAILDFLKTSTIKIAVNHQLHFHPRRQYLQDFVKDGKIGEIRYIDASSGMNLAYQGTHCLQAISAFNPDAKPISVFGQVSGSTSLQESIKKHFAPEQCIGSIEYNNGISALLRCGENAPKVGTGGIHTHKRIAVYGSEGFINWTMWSWQTSSGGRNESGDHNYPDEDILGQAAMTEAMFDWLENDNAVHPLNLRSSLQEFNVILGIYMSALRHRVIELPVQPDTMLIDRMRDRLDNRDKS